MGDDKTKRFYSRCCILFQFGFDVLCFNFFFSYSNKDVNAEIVQTYTGSSDSLPALVLVDYREVCSSCVE